MNRYKITVMKLRRSLKNSLEIFVDEGDTFGGYSHESHQEGKFLDLWFNNMNVSHTDDTRNFLTFGRIKHIETVADGKFPYTEIYITKNGKFKVEKVVFQ